MRFLAASFLFATSLFAAEPVLDPGLGTHHHAVTTGNAEAQRWFDQGMRYVYAFNHEAAVDSFKQAGKLDPDLAMAYWGTALALGPNINMDVDPDREKQAYDAVQSALAHASHGSPEERALIDALAKRYTNDPSADLHKLAVEYSTAMGALAKKYPDDLDVATLYAESLMDLRPWKLWSHEGKPAEGTEEIVATLESVLKRDANHLGANHYLIHALEASPHPERALGAAKRIAALAPSAGHLVHMPAHILQRVGDYAGAARANAKAADVDRQWIAAHGGESMYVAMYYSHNLQFGSASYAAIGDLATAKKMADEFGGAAAAMSKMMPAAEGFAASPPIVLVRFGKWRDVLAVPDPKAGPVSTALWHFTRGTAFAQLGNILGAQSEQREIEKALPSIPTDPGFTQNSQKDLVNVASHLLAGRIAMAAGDQAGAIAHYEQAVAAEDALNYDEPADWWLPSRETLGGALLRAGRAADAERVFREDLTHNPHNPRSLFGLAAAQRAQKKNAASASAEFRRMWKGGRVRIEDL
jgi:tetratricopeptide (TPR) repeat protein